MAAAWLSGAAAPSLLCLALLATLSAAVPSADFFNATGAAARTDLPLRRVAA
jgi:hypothetical protein